MITCLLSMERWIQHVWARVFDLIPVNRWSREYKRDLVRQQVQALLDGLGGLDDVIGSGDRVAIKVNLTSGTHFDPPPGVPATESYLTHPEVVRALGELLRDAGARELFIVEAVYDEESYPLLGEASTRWNLAC